LFLFYHFCDLIHLCQSFTLVLDNIVDGEAHAVALAKQLASAFLIRGAQLSVVRRIESKYVVQIQTGLLTWVGKRLATYENNKNKKSRKTAILFFRVLIPMLATLDSRDALKM
jgi:cohesin complex subunit SA-1/2